MNILMDEYKNSQINSQSLKQKKLIIKNSEVMQANVYEKNKKIEIDAKLHLLLKFKLFQVFWRSFRRLFL